MDSFQPLLIEAKKLGLNLEGLEIAQIPVPKRFYCHWLLPGDKKQYDDKGKELIDDPELMCCFNHFVGLPTRNWEGDGDEAEQIPVPLTGFNKRMMENYHKHRKYSMNKCRGSGASEILTVRWMVFKYGVLNIGKNRKCMILPGTSSKLSNELSTRIKVVCDKIPQIYAKIPTSDKPTEFKFKTGGRIMLMPATADAIRGFENVGDIILEEVAHWDMVDDMPVYNSSQAVHTKTQCHVVHTTTPRGRRGFYFNLVWDEVATSDFYKHTTNWREVVGLPIPYIEQLQEYVAENGDITEADIITMRKECKQAYKKDPEYKLWFNNFFDGISINEICDVPIGLLDVNSIVRDSITFRPEYDQELDNQFIATDSRAIGDFREEDYNPLDLRAQLASFDADYERAKNLDDDVDLSL